jgi:hypothetical protein
VKAAIPSEKFEIAFGPAPPSEAVIIYSPVPSVGIPIIRISYIFEKVEPRAMP